MNHHQNARFMDVYGIGLPTVNKGLGIGVQKCDSHLPKPSGTNGSLPSKRHFLNCVATRPFSLPW